MWRFHPDFVPQIGFTKRVRLEELNSAIIISYLEFISIQHWVLISGTNVFLVFAPVCVQSKGIGRCILHLLYATFWELMFYPRLLWPCCCQQCDNDQSGLHLLISGSRSAHAYMPAHSELMQWADNVKVQGNFSHKDRFYLTELGKICKHKMLSFGSKIFVTNGQCCILYCTCLFVFSLWSYVYC